MPRRRTRAYDEGPGSRTRGLRPKGVAGAGVEPATFRFSGGRSYQLSYPAEAVLTGFEPAASTLTGWRALQTAPQDPACRDPPTGGVMSLEQRITRKAGPSSRLPARQAPLRCGGGG